MPTFNPRAFLYFWLIVGHLRHRAARGAFAGPYWLKVKSMENCLNDEVDDLTRCDVCLSTTMRHNHSLKAQVLDGNITVANGVFTRGQSTLSLDVARWNSVSGWREHFLVMSLGELCFVYEDILTDIVKMLTDLSGASAKCPVTDGVYVGKNILTRLVPLRHFPSLPYGRFRVFTFFNFAKMAARSKGSIRSCMRVVVDIVPQ